MIRLIMAFAFCISVVGNVEAENVETKSTALKSGVFDPPRMAPDFSLPSSRDNKFTLSEQRGKLLVLGFGFSNCPNVCPMTLANLAQTYKNLGALAEQVQVVYMTVDPERDTPARLREYLANFNSHFVGVTGSADELAAVRQAYGIIAKKEVHKSGGNYEVHHSSYIYLIDRDGLLRALVPFGKSADDIAHDIKVLLQEKTQQAAL
ncbi:MAG: SCO family protein [Cellvibrio sp.]|uniref:SCO family protein n=1 Tax=Cellvibrio sp. TaxID=1965322 RepID=UPI00271C00B7|nr:SCO family protein [Cellvibrio sp.]